MNVSIFIPQGYFSSLLLSREDYSKKNQDNIWGTSEYNINLLSTCGLYVFLMFDIREFWYIIDHYLAANKIQGLT
jgi:hypothetical protein